MGDDTWTNVERFYHHRRRLDGKYDLSPETQRMLEEMGALNRRPPRRVFKQGTFRGTVIAILRERGEVPGRELYDALRDAGSKCGGSTVRRMEYCGEVTAVYRDGKRYYRLTNKVSP